MPELANPVDDGYCIGCGERSAIGLKMRFAVADDSVESRVTIPQRFQGWRGVAHGGIVALLLDEAMAYAAMASGYLGVTADLKMRFRKPVPIGEALLVRANVLWQRRSVFGISSTLYDASQTLLASAEASFVSRGKVPPEQKIGALEIDGR